MARGQKKSQAEIVKDSFLVFPEAESDIKEAYLWYEGRRPGLGEEFILSLEAAFSAIQRQPELYQIVYEQVRRELIKRFPYGVFYVYENEEIVVLAVFHIRRDPKMWQKRVSSQS